jgi:dihydrofolate synthase / folylpolyglutamate synthase
MNYQQTLDYLFSQLPMFHRVGAAAYKANLDNTIALAGYFSNPQSRFKSIHVAGTNGKGSVSHMLASIFQEAGYKTALCTSPHLKDFRERFRIDGRKIPKGFITRFVNEHKQFFDQIQPSFFEMTIAMAFYYFAQERPDIAIIETGLGGRLDSTNIITPEVSVITNIGMDHTHLLGDTLERIAAEKAGIIKPRVPVIIGKIQPETKKVFENKARECTADIYFAEENFQFQPQTLNPFSGQIQSKDKVLHIRPALTATYQYQNICTVAQTVKIINSKGNFYIPDEAIQYGLENVIQNTGLAGRWQTLKKRPLVICDTGHNVDGIKEVLLNIKNTPHQHLHFVLGMVNDKDIAGMLQLLPKHNTTYYFCKPDIPRGLEVQSLYAEAEKLNLKGEMHASVKAAYDNACSHASKNDLVFVGGSTFVVAEII